MLTELMLRCDRDPKDFHSAFDSLVDFLLSSDDADHSGGSRPDLGVELEPKGVCCPDNFYDVALDYIVIDSFEDLESPPSSVLAVLRNRWLSDGFKESALNTACWGVLQAKRRMMVVPDGFKVSYLMVGNDEDKKK